MPISIDWQPDREATEMYERILVPAILGPFAQTLVDWAALRSGDWVLDVGCGTGAATRAAAEKVGRFGRVVGIDCSSAMLDVARTIPQKAGKPIEWQKADVSQMALPSRVFDVVLCAQSLQYIPDRGQALSEIRRVLRPGGHLALSAWCERRLSPYFDALIEAISEHIGADTAGSFQAGLDLADGQKINQMLLDAGFRSILINVNRLNFALPDLDEFVPQYIRTTAMFADYQAATKPAQAAVVAAVKEKLEKRLDGGSGEISFQSHFARASV